MKKIQLAGFVGVAVVSSLYVAAQILSDVASLRILLIAGMSIDGGTLVYPFTFTLRDMVHKIAGVTVARALIITAAAVNLAMALLFLVVGRLPHDPSVGPQIEFVVALSPVWRIVIASIIAEVVSEFIDGNVYEVWVSRIGQKYQWGRVLASNSISVPLDSILFSVIAFAGVLPTAVVVSIALSNIIVKGAVTLLSMPLIYTVKASEE